VGCEMDEAEVVQLLRLHRFFACLSAEVHVALVEREQVADRQDFVAGVGEPDKGEPALGVVLGGQALLSLSSRLQGRLAAIPVTLRTRFRGRTPQALCRALRGVQPPSPTDSIVPS